MRGGKLHDKEREEFLREERKFRIKKEKSLIHLISNEIGF